MGLVVTVVGLFALAVLLLYWCCCILSGRLTQAERNQFYAKNGYWPDW